MISHYESFASVPESPSVGALEAQPDVENAIHMPLFLGKLSLSPSSNGRNSVSQAKSRRLNTGIYVPAV